ncbi:MAG: hypothetical protein ACYTE3_08860 [Planctomycetota bacterium]|jgi:hypothetical protein
MMNDREIKQFVRGTLGCTCPDEVFEHIDCRAGVNVSQDVRLDYEINVGNRLLIYLVAVDDSGSLRPLISQLVREGTGKRDRENFNRFRLVLLTQEPTDMAENALVVFQSLGADEKVHLHVVGKDDFSA